MICNNCKKKLSPIDLYCINCGVPSEGYRQQFNIKTIIKESIENSKNQQSSNNFYYIGVTIVLLLIIYLTHFQVISSMFWFNYLFINISMIFLSPLLLMPLASIYTPVAPLPLKKDESKSKTANLTEHKKLSDTKRYYPQLVLFVLILVLYFAVLKLICQGDPILNIVRFILVLWGLSIAFPVPFLIFSINNQKEENKEKISQQNCKNIFYLYKRGYYAGKYLRWHQLTLCLVCGILNLLSILLILVPLPATINFTGNVMYIWHKKQEQFSLYNKDKDY
ncbi:MAG: hypothetical protein FWG98_11850 [Candidatus Cloacimonetes bacterium]|nr:hypothetical protein [Candidatus Cloacimonadota bacterium]